MNLKKWKLKAKEEIRYALLMIDRYHYIAGVSSVSADCAPGSYWVGDPAVCEQCPLGYYQQSAYQTQCNLCTPTGYVTADYGSDDPSDCIRKYCSPIEATVSHNASIQKALCYFCSIFLSRH